MIFGRWRVGVILALLRPISTSRKRRLIAGLALALAAAPGTFVRTAIPDRHIEQIDIAAVDDLPELSEVAGFTREGVWELTSPNMDFGGVSAMFALPEESLFRTFSDRGVMLTFPMPGRTGATRIERLPHRGNLEDFVTDIEAATQDPASGDFWLAFEGSNAVARYSSRDVLMWQRMPEEWADWRSNSGPEAMTRLPDGSFLVLPEVQRSGVLHAGDPAREGEAVTFTFTTPDDYAPTDLAALPDGRVLVLLRDTKLAIPPFTVALGIFDPADIAEDEVLEIEPMFVLDVIIPRENYEGLAVEENADGSLTLWIIADDNIASFQRTLLAKLRWTPESR